MVATEIVQADYKLKLCFKAEWMDWAKSVTKKFILSFYPCDESIELFDVEAKKMYLRRSVCEGVHMKDMFVGSVIRVYSRQVELVDYGDDYTRQRISVEKEHTVALIKPSALNKLGEIINVIHRNGFSIVRLIKCMLTKQHTIELYPHLKGTRELLDIVEHLINGPSICMELVGRDSVNRWRKIVGPTNPTEAKLESPQSLRALYGLSLAANGFHAPSNRDQVIREACMLFPHGNNEVKPPAAPPLIRKNTTLCVIKPHVIAEGKLGDILYAINNSKFAINAIQMFCLNQANAEEFLEVYKGVVTDFHALVLSMLDGPLVAMEIYAKDGEQDLDVHQEFRKFVGPHDPDIARQIRQGTLRARFGINKTMNAVHCTDLPEDVDLELDYFFNILADA